MLALGFLISGHATQNVFPIVTITRSVLQRFN